MRKHFRDCKLPRNVMWQRIMQHELWARARLLLNVHVALAHLALHIACNLFLVIIHTLTPKQFVSTFPPTTAATPARVPLQLITPTNIPYILSQNLPYVVAAALLLIVVFALWLRFPSDVRFVWNLRWPHRWR